MAEQVPVVSNVLSLIERRDPVPGPPACHQVDEDGRLVRWIDKMG